MRSRAPAVASRPRGALAPSVPRDLAASEPLGALVPRDGLSSLRPRGTLTPPRWPRTLAPSRRPHAPTVASCPRGAFAPSGPRGFEPSHALATSGPRAPLWCPRAPSGLGTQKNFQVLRSKADQLYLWLHGSRKSSYKYDYTYTRRRDHGALFSMCTLPAHDHSLSQIDQSVSCTLGSLSDR